ncbi:class I SAM-dependent methyltransferase [Quadrisphaera sp. KR29]|uniref:class I SAM-dependent methyltransferase n=1 Tax=Quadrisphaera sp. KR29 TaxID=3461391 RepID=UPI0040442B47
MVDPRHFEEHAATYARARPPHPTALWDRIAALGLLRPGARALDLGAGSGQATGPLLAAGLHVTAVEPGPRLADELRAAHPRAAVVRARAEDLDGLRLRAASYDLAVAATSIHWMDLGVVLPAIHRLLTSEGRFLVWRNVFGDPTSSTPFRHRVARIVDERDSPPRPGPDAEDAEAVTAELTRGGLFTAQEVQRYRWSIELGEDEVRALFSTFSDWSSTEVDRAACAVRDLGGRVVEHYQSWMVVLQPTPPT